MVSPSTGIIDTHGLIKVLEGKTRNGGQVLYRCAVRGIDSVGELYRVTVENPGGTEQIASRVVINAGGLESDRVAAMAGVDGYRLHWCKGDYFTVTGKTARRIAHLIYPVPAPHLVGLGVHVTLDLGGRMRLGPDVTYVEREAEGILEVDSSKAEKFWRAARRYLPRLARSDLQPDMAGIRPKLQGPDDPWQDFVLREDRPGLINLVGIDSPGLTSCLSIAEDVTNMVMMYL
jgi:L-2-hydroxyglutarate oxidase LhgO